jgi:DNA primase
MPAWINFKELRSKLRFEDVLRHYSINVKKRGTRVIALCPLPGHPARTDDSPRTASLSIHLARNIFQCFGCKASGNALEFACRMEGFDPSDMEQFRKAAVRVAEVFGIDAGRHKEKARAPKGDAGTDPKPDQSASSPESAGPVVINAPLNFELQHLDPKHPYLPDRGFQPETTARFGLGYCNRGLMQGRIAIPLHNPKGELVGYAGRITEDALISDECPKYRFPGSRKRGEVQHEFRKSLLLYNAHCFTAKAIVINLACVHEPKRDTELLPVDINAIGLATFLGLRNVKCGRILAVDVEYEDSRSASLSRR